MAHFPITRTKTASGGRYASQIDGHDSELTWNAAERDGQKLMIIDHTLVPKALAGRGVGLALVRRAVEDARVEGFRIVPLCSFAQVMIARHEDMRDVLANPV